MRLDEGSDVCSIYFDLKKAFDSVAHSLLLQKLADIELDPYITQWISSYLTSRSQHVAVEGACSPVLPVLSGVPQGSVLGPLLFLIFIDDVVSQVSPGSQRSLFADNMALYRPIQATIDYSILQNDISSIASWIKSRSLSLQPKKCCAMLISRKRTSQINHPTLYVEGAPLSYVTSVKYLGILISSNLSWSSHISKIHAKARRLTGMLNMPHLPQCYNSMCH